MQFDFTQSPLQLLLRRSFAGFAWLLLAGSYGFLSETRGSAAEVRAELSTREAYVDEPIELKVVIENAEDIRRPEIPDVDGLEIRSSRAPSRSSETFFENGRARYKSSVILYYSVTAERTGEFEIPPIRVSASGQNLATEPVRFVTIDSETGDLLFVEIEGKQDRVYVGEPLDMTLKIWIRRYRDRQFEVTLDERSMWSTLSRQTSWGSFASKMQDLNDQRKRPGGREVLREDGEGTKRSYYLFEIDATIYPKRPGRIDASDVDVVFNYPEELDRSVDPIDRFFGGSPLSRLMDDEFGSPFGSERLAITKTRPIRATASVDATEVLPIPTQGRPANYQGAVGRYEISARTNSRSVRAGDPITLQIAVSGDGPLELVQAPPLDVLNEGFRVDQQPLAGFVQDDAKYFTTTVRPRSTSVTEVPAISMSYFDPESEQFQTIATQPISIDVSESETLGMDAIVSDSDTARRASEAAESSPSDVQSFSPSAFLFRNEADESILVNQPTRSILRAALMLVLLPPLCFVVVFAIANRSRLTSPGQWLGSRRQRAIKVLRSTSQNVEIPLVCASYLNSLRGAGRANATVDSIDADWFDGLGFLRRHGQSELAAELETLAHECRTGTTSHTVMVDQAVDWIERTDAARKSRWRTHGLRRPDPSRSTVNGIGAGQTVAGIVLLLLLPFVTAAAHASDGDPGYGVASGSELGQLKPLFEDVTTESVVSAKAAPEAAGREPSGSESDGSESEGRDLAQSLSRSQRSALLAEADTLYSEAMQGVSDDAKTQFLAAAEKYQQIVDSGVNNGSLFLNLGNAYYHSGQTGRAIASYLRAQFYAPMSFRLQVNGLLAQIGAGVPWSMWRVPLIGMIVLAFGSLLGWGLLIARLFSQNRSLVRWGAVCLVIAATGGVILLRENTWQTGDHAVAVVAELALRTGDGESFDLAETLDSAEGMTFAVDRIRGDWVKLRIEENRLGWVHRSDVEILR
ncbi:hypothetical protein FHS27_001144 [Rhodopirellula rubra]|uniref:BatD n=1 Tax=Aporhodopirellula rubra TaxID=980271 RepID=A0A7W5H4H0_9BACT|nr:BatD family protein [Aporhodopirellula rubra]MBB3205344.1 hypothetical protein [Aporhodopirellula rubra]